MWTATSSLQLTQNTLIKFTAFRAYHPNAFYSEYLHNRVTVPLFIWFFLRGSLFYFLNTL
ncbi:hypothetical protein COCSUDRAFT_32985 [Coccomyxa subellipsoidea C-169]|uniref:Uncharacterized protein n=1 Tax=Coccomyxa subellipsoidea (strain C-169) TaxID=574566 RepID=I0Z0H1_COCSC|nr:hypothetical protein COCSUDRAFT_32985 [Coccomyxa subellipsoidea C-169]EIE24140.1 hypothetical protein COCSUDRAFT_32985 [Coccomyxa subellipsoidea C-169]|eukprot:XP_005648684.1 hypothetical protein COCSUDRAFT_32985 [Coccomyxa subellipsoidea C-169]